MTDNDFIIAIRSLVERGLDRGWDFQKITDLFEIALDEIEEELELSE